MPGRSLRVLLLAGTVCAFGGCSAPSDQTPIAPQSSPTSQPSAAAASAGEPLDLDAIFPAGRGRELVLNNCTSCHTFVPIVILQMTKDAWERNSREHRERVNSLNDADFRALYDYVTANFNPTRPIPRLPKELLETWTSY